MRAPGPGKDTQFLIALVRNAQSTAAFSQQKKSPKSPQRRVTRSIICKRIKRTTTGVLTRVRLMEESIQQLSRYKTREDMKQDGCQPFSRPFRSPCSGKKLKIRDFSSRLREDANARFDGLSHAYLIRTSSYPTLLSWTVRSTHS